MSKSAHHPPKFSMSTIEQQAGDPLAPPADVRQVDDFRRMAYTSYESFLRDLLQDLDGRRSTLWQRDYQSPGAYRASVEPMRDKFKEMLGFWTEPDEREPVHIEEEKPLWEDETLTASRLTYSVVEGLTTYALRIVPKTPGPHPGMLIQHGYCGSPEMACGLTRSANQEDYSYRSMGLRAARHGFHVIAPNHPSGYGTLSDEVEGSLPGYDDHNVHYGKNRLNRMCILAGGTLLGLDMLASSRAVDILASHSNVDPNRIGMYGLSRGGQSALYLPALDQRIEASVSSAYFQHRLPKMIGPCSRTDYLNWFAEGQFLVNLIRYFSDADIVSLIAPRAFAVETGAHDGAVDQVASFEEYERARVHYEQLGCTDRVAFFAHHEAHAAATAEAFQFLIRFLAETKA